MKNHKTFQYYDQLIQDALILRKKVTLFLCKDEEGGFGIKINGKPVLRNCAWEVFEIVIGGEEDV